MLLPHAIEKQRSKAIDPKQPIYISLWTGSVRQGSAERLLASLLDVPRIGIPVKKLIVCEDLVLGRIVQIYGMNLESIMPLKNL